MSDADYIEKAYADNIGSLFTAFLPALKGAGDDVAAQRKAAEGFAEKVRFARKACDLAKKTLEP